MGSSAAPITLGRSSDNAVQTLGNNSNTCSNTNGNLSTDETRLLNEDADLRMIKGELFNKLIGRDETQRMILTTSNSNSNPTNSASSVAQEFVAEQSIQNNLEPTYSNENVSNGSVSNNNDNKQTELVFSRIRNRWYTNEEVASILTNFSSHPEWQSNELQVRPKSGAVLLYSREKVRYRQDGYCWKKRKNGRTTREDHMKLKVQGVECIYGCYVHSALLPTFHRRCYWLLENPDIVLVHYLNQPPDDQNKVILTFNSSALEADTRRTWTNEEIVEEIGSVFGGISRINHTLNINFPTISSDSDLLQAPQPGMLSSQNEQTSQLAKGDKMSESILSKPEDNTFSSKVTTSSHSCDSKSQLGVVGDKIELEKSPTNEVYPNSIEQETVRATVYGQQDCGGCELMGDIVSNDTNNSASDGDGDSGASPRDEDEMITQDTMDGNSRKVPQGDNKTTKYDRRQERKSDSGVNEAKQLRQITSSGDETVKLTCDISQHQDRHGSMTTSAKSPSLANIDDLKNLNDSRSICGQSSPINDQTSSDQLMDQSPCSPVTQIYNKIVDDIETYALPIEPNQFDHHHLHHQHHHHHHDHGVQSMEIVDSPSEETILTSVQPRRLSHPNLLSGRRHQPHTHGQLDGRSMNGDQVHDVSLSRDNGDQSDCSVVDLVTCDLFGGMNHEDSGGGGNQGVGDTRNEDMLLADFNISGTDVVTDHESDDIVGSTAGAVDHLSHDDDLRDLMMGISSCSEANGVSATSNLLVDTNSLNLFNFKPSNFEQRHHYNQIDVKSTTSDTDTPNRLSPMASMVPRCNSTDNALQSTLQRSDQHHPYQHHLSNNYLNQGVQVGQLAHAFPEFRHDTLQNHSLTDPNHEHASTANSTNPSNSASCSPSPSSSSLLALGVANCSASVGHGGVDIGIGLQTNSNRSNNFERAPSHHCSASSSPNNGTLMKVPLQQRQHSEQKEPSNSVLNLLLPKALSLDGSDLSATSGHYNLIHQHQNQSHHHVRGLTSPLVGAQMYREHRSHFNQNLFVPTSSDNSSNLIQHQQRLHLDAQQRQNMSMTPQHLCNRPITSRNHFYQRPSVPSLSSHAAGTMTGNYPNDTTNRMSLTPNQHRSGSMVTTSHLTYNQYGSEMLEYAKLQPQSIATRTRLLPILDYVPNWSISTGGTKVLIIGNWTSIAMSSVDSGVNKAQQMFTDDMRQVRESSDKFFAVFDELIVPATLIQSNVLRCYAPQHEPGFVALKIVYRNMVISEQVLFEMRRSSSSSLTSCEANSTSTNNAAFMDHQSVGMTGLDDSDKSMGPLEDNHGTEPSDVIDELYGFAQASTIVKDNAPTVSEAPPSSENLQEMLVPSG